MTTRKYHDSEDAILLRYLYRELKKGNPEAKAPKGNQLWDRAVEEELLPGRSSQSMRDRVRRILLPGIENDKVAVISLLSPKHKKFLERRLRIGRYRGPQAGKNLTNEVLDCSVDDVEALEELDYSEPNIPSTSGQSKGGDETVVVNIHEEDTEENGVVLAKKSQKQQEDMGNCEIRQAGSGAYDRKKSKVTGSAEKKVTGSVKKKVTGSVEKIVNGRKETSGDGESGRAGVIVNRKKLWDALNHPETGDVSDDRYDSPSDDNTSTRALGDVDAVLHHQEPCDLPDLGMEFQAKMMRLIISGEMTFREAETLKEKLAALSKLACSYSVPYAQVWLMATQGKSFKEMESILKGSDQERGEKEGT